MTPTPKDTAKKKKSHKEAMTHAKRIKTIVVGARKKYVGAFIFGELEYEIDCVIRGLKGKVLFL